MKTGQAKNASARSQRSQSASGRRAALGRSRPVTLDRRGVSESTPIARRDHPVASGLKLAAAVKTLQERRADDGDRNAQAAVGRRLANAGAEGPRTLVRGYMWLLLAAAAGHRGAARDLESLEALMSPGQVAEAKRLGWHWRASKPATSPLRKGGPLPTTHCRKRPPSWLVDVWTAGGKVPGQDE